MLKLEKKRYINRSRVNKLFMRVQMVMENGHANKQ